MAATTAARAVSEWALEPSARSEQVVGIISFAYFYAPYFVIIVAALAFSEFWVAAVAGGVYLGVVSLWIGSRGRAALRQVGARPWNSEDGRRFPNLTEGLAADIGVKSSSLWVIPDGGPNALACYHKGPVIAVRSTLLETYGRTELEAVAAHCLLRLRAAPARTAREMVALGPLAPAAVLVGGAEDAAVAAVTRYPPAVAAAVRKAAPYEGRFAPFWFVAEGPSHRSQAQRVVDLLDL